MSEPLHIISNSLKKKVAILNPHKNFSQELGQYALFKKRIRSEVLQACQFPQVMKDEKGSFYKPDSW